MKKNKLVSHSQHNEVKSIIKTLSKKVSDNLTKESKSGLFSGLSGYLLFLYNAYKFSKSYVDEEFFLDAFEKLQEQLQHQSLELNNGLAGQAWLVEYLSQSESQQYDSELLDDIDSLFKNSLTHDGILSGEIEIVLGLNGFIPYISKRHLFSNQKDLYSKVVAKLAAEATYFENGQISWSQPIESAFRFEKRDETFSEFNLGFAHGVPGIIAALLPALQIPPLEKQVRQLLIGSCDWLLCNQSKSLTDGSCFGNCAGEMHESRLGWCYGDLTIALTLARVGKAIDNPHYVERALNIALHAAKRDAKSGFIYDAGICHGYFGLVIIFQLLNKIMPHPKLYQAVQDWLQYGLEKYKKEGVSSLYAYDLIENKSYEDFSFLTGYSGIGLVLLGVLTDEPNWADCLLMA